MKDAVQVNVDGIETADIIVSIPSCNNRCDLSTVVSVVDKGLVEFFGSRTSVIINCDFGFDGSSRNAFLETETQVHKIYLGSEGSGKGRVLRYSLKKALELDAKVFVIIHPDAQNVQPVWMKKLVEPVSANFYYVAPLYVRHKDQDLLNSIIIYPLTRSLYGWRIRRPMGEELAFRRDILENIVKEDIWNRYIENDGLNICLSTLAMCYRKPMGQVFMGQPRKAALQDGEKFITQFKNLVGTILSLMEPLVSYWKKVKWSRPTAILGIDTEDVEPPEEISIDTDSLHERFMDGFRKYEEFWREIVSESVFNKVQEIRNLDMHHFNFPDQTWTMLIYDFALAFREKDKEFREHLLEALVPLYFGKALSYIRRTERMSIQQAEDCIESQCMAFEENKPYLVSRWHD